MVLKGKFDPGVTYNVGDAVVFDDGHVYHLQHPAKSGTPPVNTMFWGKVDQTVEQCALMILDAAGGKQELQADAVIAELKKQLDALKKRVTKLERTNGGAE
jgi:hypothetical protein